MGVSKNNGTPKSSILIGFSIINHPFGGKNLKMVNHWLKGRKDHLFRIELDSTHMGVSKNRGGPPKSSICSWGFPLFSPSILGAHPYSWKHPYTFTRKSV